MSFFLADWYLSDLSSWSAVVRLRWRRNNATFRGHCSEAIQQQWLEWKSLLPFWYVRGKWPWVAEVRDERRGGGWGWTVGREEGKGYVRPSWGQEDSCWCWMPGLRGKQHHVLLFTSHHSTVIVSPDLLVSAQNKRMDLSLNCSDNKGVCFIRASQDSGAVRF